MRRFLAALCLLTACVSASADGGAVRAPAVIAYAIEVPAPSGAQEQPVPLSQLAPRPAQTHTAEQAIAAPELIGADRWRGAGFSGYGVKIAVVDAGGFAGYESFLGNGLPADATAISFRTDGNLAAEGDHGTTTARIVAQLAPAATLYLANFGSTAELSALVDYLITERVQIVSFSVGFIHNGPGNGTGSVDDIVTRAVNAGMLWSVGAGNWAQQHWAGQFTDRNANSIHEFANGVEDAGRFYTAGDLITVSLRWDDPWGASCNDYDLELFGPDGSLVRASRGLQDCKQNPVEALTVLATRDGRYRARVVRAGAAPRRIDLLMIGRPDRGDGLDIAVPAGSLAEPADHPGVLTVGSTNPLAPNQLARTSSRGPTLDGRQKPELVAPSGPIGGRGFEGAVSGTSVAAPHAAGAAALLLEALPQARPPELIAQLRSRATRLPGVPEAEAGAGMLQLGGFQGIGPVLPPSAEFARLVDVTPDGAPIIVYRYRGPAEYPARFAHLLLPPARRPVAMWRLDLIGLRFDTFIPKAPAIVNTFQTFRDGDLVFFTLN